VALAKTKAGLKQAGFLFSALAGRRLALYGALGIRTGKAVFMLNISAFNILN
jgi:hypothetical protein